MMVTNNLHTMLLAVDIGNTTIGFGLFPESAKGTGPVIRKVPTHPARTAKYYKRIIAEFIRSAVTGHGSLATGPRNPSATIDTIISSVVPPLIKPVSTALREICGRSPLIVSHKLESGLTFDVPHPERVGSDRIANAVAGFHYCRKPVAVADFGTATTITIVGEKQNFLGGAILPGIHLMQRSLSSGTAKLPLAPLDKPAGVLGRDTRTSIASGIIYGTAAAVEALIKGMEKELMFKVQLVLTGGYATLMSSVISRKNSVVPDLTYEGLRLIYLKERNVK